jgi:hypothetical protein
MKKIVEEEDVQHVDAMQYAATVGIQARQENLKPIETRAGFWLTIFVYKKKGKIHSEDFELGGQNVKRVTGWADPVDNITSFAEVVCDNYEALVDEKRKRTGDEDGVSKRSNTRNRKREEQVQPTTQREVGEMSKNPFQMSQPVSGKIRQECMNGGGTLGSPTKGYNRRSTNCNSLIGIG